MRIISFRAAICVFMILLGCAVLPAIAIPAGSRQFTYRTFLYGAPKGVPVASFVFESRSASNQFTLGHGTLKLTGRILAPPPQPGAISSSFFPVKMRVSLVHQTEAGQIISKNTFDLSVNGDGRILPQAFAFPKDVVIHPNERLIASLTPLDAPLRACILDVTVALSPQISALSSAMEIATPPFPRPGIMEAAFSVSRPIAAQAKGHETFHFNVRRPERKGFVWRSGAISTFGNFVPAATGASIPGKVEMIIRHLNSGGQVLSVDSNIIQVLPTGKIPLQKFALSTIGPDRTPEELDVSFVPLDAAIPAGQLEINFSFSPQ